MTKTDRRGCAGVGAHRGWQVVRRREPWLKNVISKRYGIGGRSVLAPPRMPRRASNPGLDTRLGPGRGRRFLGNGWTKEMGGGRQRRPQRTNGCQRARQCLGGPGVASPIICRSALAIEAHRGVASLANTLGMGCAMRLALRSDGCA